MKEESPLSEGLPAGKKGDYWSMVFSSSGKNSLETPLNLPFLGETYIYILKKI